MDLAIEIDAIEPIDPAEKLRALRTELIEDEALHEKISILSAPPAEGTLGTATDMVIVALGTGGAITVAARATATVLTAWLHREHTNLDIHLTDTATGRSVDLNIESGRSITYDELATFVTRSIEKLVNDSVDRPGSDAE
ncbi:effector-associated constant component EACC1 [Nocardia jejuensis]|uniref:effector-associated constant component EACC1 n=1 Tax=Nocardia jejuensis TaxID=328049 RepID=UPI000A951CCA|nr:hypothetical protein [Nocardia jejuensis]